MCNMFSVYILKGEIVISDLSVLEGHFVVCCIGWYKGLSLHLRLPFKCNPPEMWFWKKGGGVSWMVAWTEGLVVFISEDSLLICEHLLNTCPHLKMSPKHFTVVTVQCCFLLLQSRCALVMWLNEWLQLYTVCFQSDVLTALFGCYMVCAMWNCWHLDARSVYTIQLCTSLQCYLIQSLICKVHVCLTVTCHLYFWQNNQDLVY